MAYYELYIPPKPVEPVEPIKRKRKGGPGAKRKYIDPTTTKSFRFPVTKKAEVEKLFDELKQKWKLELEAKNRGITVEELNIEKELQFFGKMNIIIREKFL